MLLNSILAMTGTSGEGSSSGEWITLVILGVAMVGMILLTIIPQKKRQKQAQQMMSALKKGDMIKTIGGFVGTVVAIDNGNNTMDINVGADGREVIVTIDKSAVYTVINPNPTQNYDAAKTVVADESEGVVTADDMEADEKKANKKHKKHNKNAQSETAAPAENADTTNTAGNNDSIDKNEDITF